MSTKTSADFQYQEVIEFKTIEEQITFLDELKEGTVICQIDDRYIDRNYTFSIYQKKWIKVKRGEESQNLFEWISIAGGHNNLNSFDIRLTKIKFRQDIESAINLLARGSITSF